MAITITDLNPITSPLDEDVLVLDDISEGTTKHITVGNLKEAILSQTAFTENAGEIVTALNQYILNNNNNGLRSTTLWADEAYRNGEYFLDYANFDNTPDIPSNLEDLVNNTGFVRLDLQLNPPRLIYYNTQGSSATAVGVHTGNVPENTSVDGSGNLIGPLYYTDDRVKDYLDANFSTYYNSFTSTFDDGNVRDSLYGVTATVVDANLDSADYQGKILQVNDADVFANFSAGQTIRIYGADSGTTPITTTGANLVLTKVGFADSNTTTGHQANIEYRIAEFNYTDGNIAPAGSIRPVTIATPPAIFDSVSNVYEAFNTDNFIRLSISGVTAGNGILVYRRTPLTNNQFVLTAVLGPKEVAEGQWIDYYNFDWTEWSGKVEEDNTYPTSVIHFPYNPPSIPKRGWVDKVIESVTIANGTLRITLDDIVFISQDQNTVSIAHNDTQKIRQAISQNASVDKKSVVLNAKTYVASAITMPENFGLTGTPYITKIVKLPWSGGEASVSSAKLINTPSSSGAKNVSIVGVDMDGNALNQFLFPDSTDATRNYIVDFGINADGPLVDKVRIRNVIGGGIFADRPIDLRVTNCEMVNSGVSDRVGYSPLYAYGGQRTTVTSNRFENFGDSIHVENTDKGIVSDNLINNVGSGLTIYGSKFFISSQNVLIGPAGEFLPTPDILNSEFDLINIDLGPAYLAQGDYISDNMTYQEDGRLYDLTQTDGTISDITYDAYYVEKLPNGGEQFWTPANVNDIVFQPRTLLAYEGQFGFTIPAAVVADIKERTGTNSYTSLTENTIIWNNVEADLAAIANGLLTSGATYDFLTQIRGGYARGDVDSSGSIQATDAARVSDFAAGTAISEATYFRIKRWIENDLLDDALRTVDNQAYDSEVHARYIRLGNPNHQGIVWRARYEHEVDTGGITAVIVPNADNGFAPLSGGNYTILVRNIKPYLSLGSEVKLVNHGGAVDGLVGTVANINTVLNSSLGTSDTTITINYSGVSLTENDIGSNSGSINIVDKFILAQGRIL